tara:strand:+ start:425 stop:868 length:444 start_codon:yes stop_codon:yes gene_type:complete
MPRKNDFERLAELAAMPSDQLERETKRAAVFLHGRVHDWYCGASGDAADKLPTLTGCGAALDIDKRPPMVVDIKAGAPGHKPMGCRVTMCKACAANVAPAREEAKRMVLDSNPGFHDADHVPPESQTMLPGTRPDPSKVLTVTMEVW